MTTIRSLDIKPRERWTTGRLPLHMAEAMSVGMRRTAPRRFRLWHFVLWAMLTPSGIALAIIAAWQILRRGL